MSLWFILVLVLGESEESSGPASAGIRRWASRQPCLSGLGAEKHRIAARVSPLVTSSALASCNSAVLIRRYFNKGYFKVPDAAALWFGDDFAAASSRGPLLLARAGLFEGCSLLLGWWGAGWVCLVLASLPLGGCALTGRSLLAPLSSARTRGWGGWDAHALMSRLDTA